MATTSQGPSHSSQGSSWLNTRILWLRELPKAIWAHQAILWATAVIAIVIDQRTKWWVEDTIDLYSSIAPIEAYAHIFDYLHVKNPGAAFGTGQELGWLFTTIAIVVCCLILFYNLVILGPHRGFRTALGLILGGALGNVIDRFRIGEVTDFIHFDFRPLASEWLVERVPLLNFAIFNLADTFIFSGVCIMFWLMWKDVLPDDPWTEEEPVTEEFEDWQRSYLAKEKAAANDSTKAYSTYSQAQPSDKPNSWQADSAELENSDSDGRLGLKIALALGAIGLIVAFIMLRKRRK